MPVGVATPSDVAPATQPTIAELLALDRFALSPRMHAATSASDRWMRRYGLPVGIAVFLALLLAPTPAGLTAGGQAAVAAFALARCTAR